MGDEKKENAMWSVAEELDHRILTCILPFLYTSFPDSLNNFLSTGEIAKYENGPELRHRFPLASNIEGSQQFLSLDWNWNEITVLLGFLNNFISFRIQNIS